MASTVGGVFVILSNVTFIIPSIKAAFLHRYTRAILYFLMMLASMFYHIGKAFPWAAVLPPVIARKDDFFFAQWLIFITALYLIYFPPRYEFIERWAIFLTGFGLFLIEVYFNEPFSVQLIIAVISVVVVIIYWCLYARYEYLATGKARLPPYNWDMFAYGIAFTALACTLFATQENWPLGYDWVHAVWHTSAALGQYFILCTRDAANPLYTLDKKVFARYDVLQAALSG